MEVDDDQLAELRTFQPAKMYVEEIEEKKQNNADEKKRLDERRVENEAEAARDLKREVA